jgi:hypothetical protein
MLGCQSESYHSEHCPSVKYFTDCLQEGLDRPIPEIDTFWTAAPNATRGHYCKRKRGRNWKRFDTDRLLARAWPLAPILEQSLDAAVHVGFLPALCCCRVAGSAPMLSSARLGCRSRRFGARARTTIFCGVLPSATSRSSVVRSLGLTCRPVGIL